MRRDILLWWEQSLKDFEVAKKNFKNKDYYICAFLCQQSAEKALKALYILKKQESSGTTHSLIFLAKETGVPSKFFDKLASLSQEFIATRYPDIADEAPYKLYSEERTKDYLDLLEDLFKWLKKQIIKQKN